MKIKEAAHEKNTENNCYLTHVNLHVRLNIWLWQKTHENLYLIQLLDGMASQQKYETVIIFGDKQGTTAF